MVARRATRTSGAARRSSSRRRARRARTASGTRGACSTSSSACRCVCRTRSPRGRRAEHLRLSSRCRRSAATSSGCSPIRRRLRGVFGAPCPTYLSSTSRPARPPRSTGTRRVDVDVGPAQTGELAWAQPAHQPGQPHRRPRIGGDGVGEQRCACSIVKLLRSFDGRRRQQHSAAGLVLIRRVAQAVLARLVEVVPVAVDRARRVAPGGHRLEQLLEPVACRPVHPELTDDGQDARAAAAGRALAIVFGDFTRAWRGARRRHVGAAVGQPRVDHLGEGRFCRRGPGSSRCARSASSSSRSRLRVGLSTRSTLRRDPSGNRTHAIHRRFSRSTARWVAVPRGHLRRVADPLLATST